MDARRVSGLRLTYASRRPEKRRSARYISYIFSAILTYSAE